MICVCVLTELTVAYEEGGGASATQSVYTSRTPSRRVQEQGHDEEETWGGEKPNC